MAVQVADLTAKLTADISGFKGPIGEATKQLDLFQAAATSAAEKTGESFDELQKQMASGSAKMRADLDAMSSRLKQRASDLDRELTSIKAVDAAMNSLGLKSTAQIAEQKDRILTAVETIRSSSTATEQDIARAGSAASTLLSGLSAETSKFGTIFSAAFTTVERGAAAAGIELGAFGKIMGVASSLLTGGVAAASAFVIIMGTIYTAAKKAADALAEETLQLRELSTVSGLSVGEANKLAGVMQLLGQNSGALQSAFFRLGFVLEQGGGSLDRWGVSLRDANGEMKSEGQVLLEFRSAISSVGDSSVRNAALLEQFGRSGRRLGELFALTDEDLKQYIKRSQELSDFTEHDNEVGRAYIASKQELARAFEGLASTVGVKVAPAFIFLNKTLADVLKIDKEFIDSPKEFVYHLAIKIGERVVELTEAPDMLRQILSALTTLTIPSLAIPLQFSYDQDKVEPYSLITSIKRTILSWAAVTFPPLLIPINFIFGGSDRAGGGTTSVKQMGEKVADDWMAGFAAQATVSVQSLKLLEGAIKQWEDTSIQGIDAVTARNQAANNERRMSDQSLAAAEIASIRQRTQIQIESIDRQVLAARTNAFGQLFTPDPESDAGKKVTALLRDRQKVEADSANAILASESKMWKAMDALSQDHLRVVQSGMELEAQARSNATDMAISEAETLAKGQQEDALSLAMRLEKIQEDGAQARFLDMQRSLENERTLTLQKYAGKAADQAKLNNDLALIDDKERKAALDRDKVIAQARLGLLGAYIDEAKRDAEAETAHWKEEAAKQLAIFDDLQANRVKKQEETVQRIQQMLTAPDMDPSVREQLQTQLFIQQSNLRIATSQTEHDKIVTQVQRETTAVLATYANSFKDQRSLELDEAEQRAKIRVKAFQDSLRTEAQIEKDEFAARLKIVIDNYELEFKTKEQITKEGVQRLIRIQVEEYTASLSTLEDAAAQGALAMVNAQAAVLEQRNAFIGDAQQAALRLAEATATATGDIGTAIEAMFARTLTVGKDFWANMGQLAQDFGQATQGSLSDLFFDWMSGKFNTLSDVASAFWTSMKRAIANFLASTVVNELGQFFAMMIGASSGNASGGLLRMAQQLLSQAKTIAGSATTDAGGSPVTDDSTSLGGVGSDNTLSSVLGGAGNIVGGLLKNLSSLGTMWTALSNAYSAFNVSLSLGNSTMGAFSDAVSTVGSTLESAGGALGGLTSVLGYAAAAIQGFSIIMDQNKSNLGKAIQTATLAVGVALSGWTAGISAIAAPLINWLEDMFGLFKKQPSNYDLKRIQAADEANRALGSVGASYQGALTSMDVGQLLRALQTGAGGPGGNAVRTELVLPTGLASQIGIAGQQIGDQVVAQWTSITLDQFKKVLQAFKEQPGLIDQIRGSGDVPYLAQGDAQNIANQIAEGAKALIKAFETVDALRDKIGQVATDMVAAAAKVLPPSIGDQFATAIVNPIRDRMVAVLQSGLPGDQIQAQLTALSQELQAYGGMVNLYAQITQDVAQLSGDFATQTQGAIMGIKMALDAMDAAVATASSAASSAATPQAQLEAETALRQTILARYASEMQMVQQIEATISSIIQTISKPAVDNQIAAAVTLMNQNISAPFDNLFASLMATAQYATSLSERLFAVSEGFNLVAAAAEAIGRRAPTTLTTPSGASTPVAVWQAVVAASAPFFNELQVLIGAAAAAHDLATEVGLLQQQADAIKQMGAAAVAAVQAWQQSAVSAANAAAQAASDVVMATYNEQSAAIKAQMDVLNSQITAIDAQKAQIDAQVKVLNTQIDAINKQAAAIGDQIQAIDTARQATVKQYQTQIDAVQEAARVQTDLNNAQIDALQTQLTAAQAALQTAREWEGVVKSTQAFILSLKLSAQSPLNPAEQLKLARAQFTALQGQFTKTPTAETAGELQRAAQDLLNALGNVFTRPSPQYQATFTSVVQALQKVATLAQKQAPVSSAVYEATSEILQTSINQLKDWNKSIADTAKTQVEGLQQLIKDVNTQADAQIDVLKSQQATLEAAKKLLSDQIDELKTQESQLDAQREVLVQQVGELQKTQAALDTWKQDQLDAIEKQRTTQIQAINDAARATIDQINAGTAAALLANAYLQQQLAEQLRAQQEAQLRAIIGDDTVQAFQLKKQQEAVTLLTAIDTKIGQLLSGIPQAQSGMPRTREGYYYLHDEEAVLSPPAATAWRNGAMLAPSWGSRSDYGTASDTRTGGDVTIVVNVDGDLDAEKVGVVVAQEVKRVLPAALDQEVRFGTATTKVNRRNRGTPTT